MATKRYWRDFKEVEARCRRGMRMLAHGVSQAEVARAGAVTRQTAMTWVRMLAEEPQAWQRRPPGRPGVFDEKDRARLARLLPQGAMANGFPTELWTLTRVATLIERHSSATPSASRACGRCCAIWGCPLSARWVEPRGATSRRFSSGRPNAGRH